MTNQIQKRNKITVIYCIFRLTNVRQYYISEETNLFNST